MWSLFHALWAKLLGLLCHLFGLKLVVSPLSKRQRSEPLTPARLEDGQFVQLNKYTHDAAYPTVKARRRVRNFIKGVARPSEPDQTNAVINGASTGRQHILRNIIADLASQSGRWGADLELLSSLAETKFLDGGIVDDKDYQMEKILQLVASLPEGQASDDLTHSFLKQLWENLQHPPLSILGREYRYRTADGRNNNMIYPNLGQAGSHYARTVAPKTLQPGIHPDPGLIFDSIFARKSTPKEHPNKLSSMIFYFASIIIHDVFHTDERDPSKLKTSSYLDLAPLYGSSQSEQDRIRTFRNGLIKPDTFSEVRLLGFPPGVAALAICFCRFHNYVAIQLREINEDNRFPSAADEQEQKTLDEDLFQTARLITCGLYVNIILTDYVRTILNLNRTDSTWTLDPRQNFNDFFDTAGIPSGIGNQVSCEFNLIYRWHSTISKKDEKWSEAMYQKLFGNEDISTLTEKEFVVAMRKWLMTQPSDPSTWTIDGGKCSRTSNGTFRDEDLAKILSDGTEDVACAFGPRQVPVVLKLVEIMGIKQARAWNVATLNEFRKFFKLEPHKTFKDITSDAKIATALEGLYEHPDYVELYPGLVAEDAKESKEPGSGLCPGFTISRSILSDAVALVRGDRFYTIDYSPATLTNWGYNQVKSDPEVAQGGCFYNLVMRALPNWYRGNSVYAMFPFTIPSENCKILHDLGKAKQYSFNRPSFVRTPTPVKSWEGCVAVLHNQRDFRVPWGAHTYDLTGHDYMLSGDRPRNTRSRKEMQKNLYCPANGLEEVRKFYEALTTQLIETNSHVLRGNCFQLDACKDVSNPSHAVFVAQLFHIPLKAEDSMLPAVQVDQLYLAMSVLFAYVFLDADTARSFKLRKGAKDAGGQLSKLISAVCLAVKAGNVTGVSKLLDQHKGSKSLRDYGVRLIERMFEGEKSVDEVVWNIIPTAAAAVATQAQHCTQMLDLYMSDEYNKHWADIQQCAMSDTSEDFERLKSYALEANRLAPAAYGLLRRAASPANIVDGEQMLHVREGEQLYLDFVSAGVDPSIFPSPYEIKLDRPRHFYIHHGFGAHACLGRPIVEVAMAAQLKVFAKLKGLRRAPGLQGVIKKSVVRSPNPVSSNPVPSPGYISVFMKEDWSDWWPFPTTLKLHHEGWIESQKQQVHELLQKETGLPQRMEQTTQMVESNPKAGEATQTRPGLLDHRRGRSLGSEAVKKKSNKRAEAMELLYSLKRRDTR